MPSTTFVPRHRAEFVQGILWLEGYDLPLERCGDRYAINIANEAEPNDPAMMEYLAMIIAGDDD